MIEEFWNIPGWLVGAFYILAAGAAFLFILGFYDKFRIWSGGEDRDEELKGLNGLGLLRLSIAKFFSSDCLFAGRVLPRSKVRGVLLIGIMWSFLLLFLGTVGRSLNHYVLPFLSGGTWLFFSLILDLAGVVLLIGTVYGLYRRYLSQGERIATSLQDGVLLWLLLFTVLSGFFVEGLRIVVMNPWQFDWSPAGLAAGMLVSRIAGGDPSALKAAHWGIWTFHFLLSLAFIAYIPYSKSFHMFASQITTYLRARKMQKDALGTSSLGFVRTQDIDGSRALVKK